MRKVIPPDDEDEGGSGTGSGTGSTGGWFGVPAWVWLVGIIVGFLAGQVIHIF